VLCCVVLVLPPISRALRPHVHQEWLIEYGFIIKYECSVVSCHSGKKKVVVLSDNDMQAILHGILLSRYYRL
jgi:hypothetical protein